MLNLQITTTTGQILRLAVTQIEFIQTCPVGPHEFLTIDPDQIYCCKSHKQAAYWKRACNYQTPPSSHRVHVSA